jgi:hypothetical protein
MRLFRQPAPGDWAGVMERVAAEVAADIRKRAAEAAAGRGA